MTANGCCIPTRSQRATTIFSPRQRDYDHAELILEAYEWHTSRAGGARGAVMLGDEMIDEASRKMALVIAGKGRAAGMERTTRTVPAAELAAKSYGAHCQPLAKMPIDSSR